MATPEAIRHTIAQYIERFSAKDTEGWLALFADDATVEDPIGSGLHTGHDEIRAFWEMSQSLSPSIVLHPNGPSCVAGSEAAFPILIVSAVGDSFIEIDATDAMTFTDDAKIASLRAYWDFADMRPVTE